jgi:hypothetical protein
MWRFPAVKSKEVYVLCENDAPLAVYVGDLPGAERQMEKEKKAYWERYITIPPIRLIDKLFHGKRRLKELCDHKEWSINKVESNFSPAIFNHPIPNAAVIIRNTSLLYVFFDGSNAGPLLYCAEKKMEELKKKLYENNYSYLSSYEWWSKTGEDWGVVIVPFTFNLWSAINWWLVEFFSHRVWNPSEHIRNSEESDISLYGDDNNIPEGRD